MCSHHPGHGARPRPVMMIPLRRCGSHALRLRLNLSPQFYSPYPLHLVDMMPLLPLRDSHKREILNLDIRLKVAIGHRDRANGLVNDDLIAHPSRELQGLGLVRISENELRVILPASAFVVEHADSRVAGHR